MIRWLAVALLVLAVLGVARADAPPAPEYRMPPRVTSVHLDEILGLRRLDVPGRPRLTGVLPEEVAQVAPSAGRVMVVAGGYGRLYRPGMPKPLWSGAVDGPWALSPDGKRLAVAGADSVRVVTFEKPRKTRWFSTNGPVRPLFSRDGKRLMLVDGLLELVTHDLVKNVPAARARLFKGGGMVESLYLFPDGRTLFFNLQREARNGSAYCRDLPTGRTSMVVSYNAVDWTARYRVSWDGRFMWSGSVLPDGRGTSVVSDIARIGVRGDDESPILMQALMTFMGNEGRPGVASVGNAAAYGIADRIELLDPVASTLTRIEGWPVHPGEGGPVPIGFLEPQGMLAVHLGPSIYLVPIAFATAHSTPVTARRPLDDPPVR